MPVIANINDFLAIARKSNQIDTARLDAFLAGHASLPTEAHKFAALLIRQGLITTFQAEQFLQGKYKGFYLGGYRVIERLGTGGGSTVYLAEHELMKRRAAIKVLPTPLADDPVMVERFQIEAEAAAILDHPNIVHLYDFRQEGRLYYLVMEYIDGPDLQQVIARKRLSIPRACDYARQSAIGLHHAHQSGLVHRDVKPANILVDSAGTIKILDLGLARVEREVGESVTQKFNNGAVLGTADYLAPEQAINLHDVDLRADVYSLGATLYALLTGQPPFHSGTIGQKLMWHQTRVPPLVNTIRAEIPQELALVVAKMLQKNPDDRYSSMTEVAEALSPWADQAPAPRKPQRSLAEIRLGRSNTASPATVRLLGKPRNDTRMMAEQDTARIESNGPTGAADSGEDGHAPLCAKVDIKWLIIGSLTALAVGVLGVGLLLLVRA